MEYVTDTDPFVCYYDLVKRPELGAEARQAFSNAEWGKSTIYVPSVVCIEILERVLDASDLQPYALQKILSLLMPDRFHKLLHINEEIAEAASKIPPSLVPNLYDRIITATAVAMQCPLITKNSDIIKYDQVKTVWDSPESIINKSVYEQVSPTIGIITALPKEYVAVKTLLDDTKDYIAEGKGAGRKYFLGTVPAIDGTKHHLVLALADMGNNSAVNRATLLLEHFKTVSSVIMVGIAGGIPNPENPDEHVRLGDIVVSGPYGVIQYDFDKETVDDVILRHRPRPPSPILLEGVRHLQVAELEGDRPWQTFISKSLNVRTLLRPPIETDILADSNNTEKIIVHPEDPKRKGKEDQPRVFIGSIASANKLLKNPIKRDELRIKLSTVKAVEMEASGIADATWNREAGYLVVRGICDYCDSNKGDIWQDYAATVAAAYMRALLETIPCQ